MIPLLLYAPPLIEVGALDIKSVAGVTMTQVLVAATAGVLAHRRYRTVNRDLALAGGPAMAAGSLAGALVSRYVHERWLLLVFALMVTGAAFLMFVPVDRIDHTPDARQLTFSRPRAAIVSGGVGVAAGLVGAGGAFLLVPLLLVVVGVPIRVTIGSSLAITAVAATAGFVGKLVTRQIPLGPALVVALGAVPGAQLGALASRRLSDGTLKRILFIVIVLTGVRVWWHVLFE